VPSKPWASGRTLTAAQRARKRALDRQSHRQRRNRTESRIAELEAWIKALRDERADKGGTETSSENPSPSHDTPPQRLDHIPDLIPTSWNAQDFVDTGALRSSPGASISAISPDHLDGGPSDCNSSVNGATALNSMNEMMLATPEQPLPSNIGQPFLRISAAERMVTDSPTIFTTPVQTIDACGGISTTQLCNMELSKASQLTGNQVCRDELVNQDSIIRAILQGWETIECRGYVCPLWETLHRIDDLIFSTSSNITRLVMLYTVHRMLLVSSGKFWQRIWLISDRFNSVVPKRSPSRTYRLGTGLGNLYLGHPPTQRLRVLGRRSADFSMRLSWVTSPGELNTLDTCRVLFGFGINTDISSHIIGLAFVSDWSCLKRGYSATRFGIVLRIVSAFTGRTI
jgi:hypothetical protein